jgi:hypothetical protein
MHVKGMDRVGPYPEKLARTTIKPKYDFCRKLSGPLIYPASLRDANPFGYHSRH